MIGGPTSSPPTTADSTQSVRIREEDAKVVAGRVFNDFGLTDDELGKAADVLAILSGGNELEEILRRARTKPGEPWEQVSLDRRETCLSSAMAFHCAPVDMERMALRTGAGLFLLGEDPALGSKILGAAPDSSFGVEPVGLGVWARVGQFSLYAAMFALLVAQSAVSGLYLFLFAAVAALGAGLAAAWLIERSRRKLRREGSEARRYFAALGPLTQGADPRTIFHPDGSLIGAGTPSGPDRARD